MFGSIILYNFRCRITLATHLSISIHKLRLQLTIIHTYNSIIPISLAR